MPREKFVTLTEAMFYILICLQKECCGTDIMQQVHDLTEGRVRIGPGTLYNLLDQFLKNNMIQETGVQGRRKNYQITQYGKEMLELEYERIKQLAKDYERSMIQ
ncbi:MAG: helix-turn-helix transcriptional regulator [Lachnospiraceae bacterium]|nr:helix-turn-helix transcriptional regulator [Lachnospiraceae bacterium]